MYQIKSLPEDFYVREIINLPFKKGQFSYYWLSKTGFSTMEAVDFLSQKLRIPKKLFNFAGAKDKKAVTEQALSIKQGPHKDFDFGKIRLEFLGTGEEQINLGENIGNYFEIILRDVRKMPEEKKWFINYFDDQRFSNNNAEIGRAIVKKEFEKAIALILENRKKGYERNVEKHLNENKNDFIGALRKADKSILRMYIHSFQSFLWNEKVSSMFSGENNENEGRSSKKISYALGQLEVPLTKPENTEVELFGFGSKEGFKDISPRDFIIKEIPELSSEGAFRQLVAEAEDLKTETKENEVKLSFSLPKGSYATMLVKQLFA